MRYILRTVRWILNVYLLLCFACDDGSASPFPPGGVVVCCAVELSGGLCATDGGSDDFAGCKAHGCGLLVKLRFSLRPSLCYHNVVVC